MVKQGGLAASGDLEGATADGNPERPELRVLDDRLSNTLRQMVMAMAGMFLAFCAAEWVSTNFLSQSNSGGAGDFALRATVFVLFGLISIYLTSARPIRRALIAQKAAVAAEEAALREQAERHRLVGRMQASFEMAESDHEAFGVVGEALALVGSGPGELLLADSSRAHLRRVATDPDRGGPGCTVETPWSCPAVRRSRTVSFADSQDLDACPRLKERSSPASALCVPVTVLGTPMGVLHVTGAPGEAPAGRVRMGLEALSEQAGSRIGVLRAMAASELQATTDPLTGLLNRRSLEWELARMREVGREFAVGFLDLDHFKDLNDTFGHETGDRALRSFARLIRQTVRDVDLVCRYGGEEFVVVFPDSSASEIHGVVERLAARLAETVHSGEVPPFTVSVGLADTTMTDDPMAVIRHADEAMFRAKQAGRDRIELASGMDVL